MGFARSEYGEAVGQIYHDAGVSGPSEFGDLPPADRRFWNQRLIGKARREKERNN